VQRLSPLGKPIERNEAGSTVTPWCDASVVPPNIWAQPPAAAGAARRGRSTEV